MRHDWSKANKRKAASIGAACLAMIGLLYFVMQGGTGVKNQDKGLVKPDVTVYTVLRQDMMRRISLFGQTVSDAQIDIAPKYSGRITAVNVNLGDRVRAGDILLVQDIGDLELSISQNRAAARQAEADTKEAESVYEATYQKVQADYERTKTNVERYRALYEQGAVSKEALDSIQQEMINSKAALDTLLYQAMSGEIPASVESKRAALAKTERGTAALEKQRDDLVLRAPRDGVIGYRAAEVGAIAQAGQKVLELVDNSHVYVDCQLSEQDVAAISTGLDVAVKIDSLGNTYPGKIIFISPATSSSSKNYAARIELLVAGGELKAGMFGRTQVEILQRPQTLFVPKECVIEKNGKTSVFVIDAERKAQERFVELGLRNDTQVEILSGVEEGDVVAASNLSRLRNGLEVNLDAVGDAS